VTGDALAKKVVVVTGAAQGIGAGYGRRLVAAGATVIFADRNADGVAAATTDVPGPGEAVPFVLDVATRDGCASMAEFATERYGRVDGLINNAAIFSTITMKPFWEITEAEWDTLMAVNLKGPWLLISALLPLLRAAERASIVNIGSDAVQMGRPGYLHYIASKGGVHGMTFSMARVHRDRPGHGEPGAEAGHARLPGAAPGRGTRRHDRARRVPALRREQLHHRADLLRQRRARAPLSGSSTVLRTREKGV